MKWRRFEKVGCAVSGTLFALCALIDYAIPSAYVMIHYPDLVTPAQTWYATNVAPTVVTIGQGIGLFQFAMMFRQHSFGVVAFFIFAVFVGSFYHLTRNKVDTFLYLVPISIMAFELGIIELDYGEFDIHVTDFLDQLGMGFITNRVVLYAVIPFFLAWLVVKAVAWAKIKEPSPEVNVY